MNNALTAINRKRRTITPLTFDIILLSLIVVLTISIIPIARGYKQSLDRAFEAEKQVMLLKLELATMTIDRDRYKAAAPPEIADGAVEYFEQNKIKGGR